MTLSCFAPSRYVISIISITSISYDASIVTLYITSVKQNVSRQGHESKIVPDFFLKQKISPKGDRSGLFYLTILGTEAEDYTRVYRGKVTTQRKWKIEQINDEVQES